MYGNGPSQSTLADRSKTDEPPRDPKLSHGAIISVASPEINSPAERNTQPKQHPQSREDNREYADLIL